ncbi:MAG: hypothetical protein ACP5KA_03805 [Desulfurococcaceae archaeon]
MGGLKKPKVATPTGGSEKEIRIVTRHVFTAADVEKNPRLVKLLYVISLCKDGVSEKGLAHLLNHMASLNAGLGYKFDVIGGVPVSRELMNDLTVLKYTGLVEVLGNRKLRATSAGRELLEKVAPKLQGELEAIKKAFEESWPKVVPIDVEVSLKAQRR